MATASFPLRMNPHRNANTTETLRGHPLAERVLARQAELEDALAHLGPNDTVEVAAIETALATLASLLTGDVTHPTDVVAHDLNTWLERNRYLGMSTRRIRGRRMSTR